MSRYITLTNHTTLITLSQTIRLLMSFKSHVATRQKDDLQTHPSISYNEQVTIKAHTLDDNLARTRPSVNQNKHSFFMVSRKTQV